MSYIKLTYEQLEKIVTALKSKISSHTHSEASTTAAGFMSANDKKYINELYDNISITKSNINGLIMGLFVGHYGGVYIGPDSPDKIGQLSFCQGNSVNAGGWCAHAQGTETDAKGNYSHAEGCITIAEGDYSHAEGYGTIAHRGQHVEGYANIEKTTEGDIYSNTNNSLLIVGNGTPGTRSNAFRVAMDGKCYGKNAFVASGADYAECFEWFDGNTENEDRRGLFVTLEGEKIRTAKPTDDYVLGVISVTPLIVGDTQSETWKDMYKTDIYGAPIIETKEVEETTDERGHVIPAHTSTQFVVNPDYDPDREYKSREERPEWGTVGMFGKLVVRDDGTCEVNGYCKAAEGGIATKADTGYRVIARLDDTHIKVLIK